MVLLAIVIQAGIGGMLVPAIAFPLMVATRGIFVLFGSGTFPAAQAYIADRTTRRERTPALAMIGAAFGVGIGALLVDLGMLASL